MIEILSLALPFFALVALGFIAAKLWDGTEAELKWLNIFVLYFALPALIFNIVAGTPLEKLSSWWFAAAAILTTSTAYLLSWFVARKQFAMLPRDAALAATAAAYGNVGYMGLPLSVAFFGSAAGVPAALVFFIDCTILFLMTAVFSAQSLSRTLINIVSHPFNIATAAGMLASALHISMIGPVGTVLEMLARAAGPCALFAMGCTVGLRHFTKPAGDIYALTLMKLIVQPTMMFAAMTVAGVTDPVWVSAAVMMAALPTASNAFILARQHDSYVRGASLAVLVTTVLSALTIPGIVYVLTRFAF